LITKDYKSKEEGCMTKMLNELNLPALQSRRQKQRLVFFYKVVEGQVPAMPSDLFVNYQKTKRHISAETVFSARWFQSIAVRIKNECLN
jgi:hypothetical protein